MTTLLFVEERKQAQLQVVHSESVPGKRGWKVVLESRCCTSPVPSLAACIATPNLQKHAAETDSNADGSYEIKVLSIAVAVPHVLMSEICSCCIPCSDIPACNTVVSVRCGSAKPL